MINEYFYILLQRDNNKVLGYLQVQGSILFKPKILKTNFSHSVNSKTVD